MPRAPPRGSRRPYEADARKFGPSAHRSAGAPYAGDRRARKRRRECASAGEGRKAPRHPRAGNGAEPRGARSQRAGDPRDRRADAEQAVLRCNPRARLAGVPPIRTRQRGCRRLRSACLRAPDRSGPVSYTHLDVYKRQTHHQSRCRHAPRRTGRRGTRDDGDGDFRVAGVGRSPPVPRGAARREMRSRRRRHVLRPHVGPAAS